MADIKISSVQDTSSNEANIDDLERVASEKLQAMGKSMVASLYMLIRSVKLYAPENAIFEKPVANMVETMNSIIAKEGRLELQGLKNSFYLNNMLVKVDASSLDNVKELLDELR